MSENDTPTVVRMRTRSDEIRNLDFALQQIVDEINASNERLVKNIPMVEARKLKADVVQLFSCENHDCEDIVVNMSLGRLYTPVMICLAENMELQLKAAIAQLD